MERVNEFGQPVGEELANWTTCQIPEVTHLDGRYTRVSAMSVTDHASDLWRSFRSAPNSLWTYMSIGPFLDEAVFVKAMERLVEHPDRFPYVVEIDGVSCGLACYMRVEPALGVLEIGSIVFSPSLQRSTAATETLYLMINHAMQLGYRRCEWKCDDLNMPSRSAAERIGFRYEGTFRKATHYKGRSRDTAWYALTDDDWALLTDSYEAWLAPDNFGGSGRQILSLAQLRS